MSDLVLHGSSSSLQASTTENEGYLAGGAFGFAYPGYRFELNLDWRSNGVNSIHVGNSGAFPGGLASGGATGSVNSFTGTINGYLDLPFAMSGFVPYIGAGAGFVNLSVSQMRTAAGTTVIDDTDAVAAVVGMAGVRYDLNTSWAASLEYKFLNGFGPSFRDATGRQVSTNDYRDNSVLLKITYSFGAPPPPPPEMPAAAPAPPPVAPAPQAAPTAGPRQLFLVFFDFDKSTLTSAGRQVLDAAFAAWQKDQPIRIEVTGYTDTVGTQKYNLGLSERRADAVRDYLSRKGVPVQRMDVAWKGKEDLRVPTPDGVREPQNRRVEIIIP